jgi:hypothetical protein
VKSWRFVGTSKTFVSFPSKEGWLVALNATRLLVGSLLLEHEMSYVLISRFTQDFLENIFSQIRAKNGNCCHPRCEQFISGMQSVNVSRVLASSTNRSRNYCDDNSTLLLQPIFCRDTKVHDASLQNGLSVSLDIDLLDITEKGTSDSYNKSTRPLAWQSTERIISLAIRGSSTPLFSKCYILFCSFPC